MKKWLMYPILLLILITGFLLRSYNIYTWPREGATFDEFAWTFLGISLWSHGIPTSWSPHGAYTLRQEYFNPQGTHFTLVTPYLEHPPLFGLLAGGFARIRGVRTFDQVTIHKIRPLALVLGVLSIIGVYLLATAVYGTGVGLIASAIYAITPTVAIGSRLVQNENFFIPFLLFALYFAYSYTRHNKMIFLYASVLICSVLPLAKVPWVAAPIAVIGILLYAKKRKEAVITGVVTALFFLLFLMWGYLLDSQVFINLWKLQLARYDMTFDGIFVLFRDPLIADRLFVDGWIYFGWIAICMLLLRDIKKNMPIIFGFLAYLAIFIFAIPAEPLHGWYRYPFYPFLSISIAVLLYDFWNTNLFVFGIWAILAGLSMLSESFQKNFGFSYTLYRSYIALVFFSMLPQLFPTLARYPLFRYMRILLVFLICIFSAYATMLYTEQ